MSDGPPAHRLRRRLIRIAATVVASGLAVSGCMTGERPRLVEGAATTGDPAIDAVLAELDDVASATFTATYDIVNRFGPVERRATVVQASPTRRSITIGDVRFIVDGKETASCQLGGAAGRCTEVISAEMVSDVQVTPDFYAASTATRLRRDATRLAGPTEASTVVIAGRDATCAAVPVEGGTVTYCALDSGVVARLDGADVSIELIEYRDTPEERYFRRRR